MAGLLAATDPFFLFVCFCLIVLFFVVVLGWVLFLFVLVFVQACWFVTFGDVSHRHGIKV